MNWESGWITAVGGGEASREASRLSLEVLRTSLKKIEVNLTDTDLSP